MPDVGNTAVFSQTDASNNSATMPGWNGAALPSTIDDAGRAFQGAFTREWNWRSPTITSGGSGNAQTLTYSVAPAALYNGQIHTWIAGFTNTGSATLNINALGATTIKKVSGGSLVALTGGEITAGDFVTTAYNSAGTCEVLLTSPKQLESFIIAVSDETTAITTGTAKVTFRMPYAFTVTAVRASLTTASSSGTPTVDINEGGTTIISTKITIDANELTSTTAAVPAVISDTALADDALMTIDIDVAGTGAKGLKVCITGKQA